MDVTAVALLHEDGEFGRQTSKSQKAYLAAAGIEVVADIEYAASQADLHNQMLAVKQSGAQAILTATFLGDAALIAQDADLLHVDLPSSTRRAGCSTPASSPTPGAQRRR